LGDVVGGKTSPFVSFMENPVPRLGFIFPGKLRCLPTLQRTVLNNVLEEFLEEGDVQNFVILCEVSHVGRR